MKAMILAAGLGRLMPLTQHTLNLIKVTTI